MKKRISEIKLFTWKENEKSSISLKNLHFDISLQYGLRQNYSDQANFLNW